VKRGHRPTTTRKNRKKKVKETYSKAREDAQLLDVIPTEPVGAVRDERADPRLQGCQLLPKVIREALRNSWATPDEAKAAIVGNLLEPFFATDVVLDRDGNQVRVAPDRTMLIELAKTLKLLDQTQFERDHPEAAGLAKGGGATQISVQTNIAAVDLLKRMIEDDQGRSAEQAAPLALSGAPGDGGHDAQVEAGAPLGDHQPGADPGVADP
jgi:hypothetical protein